MLWALLTQNPGEPSMTRLSVHVASGTAPGKVMAYSRLLVVNVGLHCCLILFPTTRNVRLRVRRESHLGTLCVKAFFNPFTQQCFPRNVLEPTFTSHSFPLHFATLGVLRDRLLPFL